MFVMLGTVLSGCSTLRSWWADDEGGVAVESIAKPELQISKAEQMGAIHIQWQVDVDQRAPATPSGFSLPFIVHTEGGDRIVAGSQDRRVRIYDLQGKEIDRIALIESCESGGLQLSTGIVVVGDIGGHLYGLDVEKAEVVWQQDLPSLLMSNPVSIGNDFIIQTADNRIYRFTAAGEKKWSYSGPSGGLSMRLTPSPLVVKGDQVFAAFSNGDVVALKGDSGSLLWKRQLILDNRAAVLSELKVPVSTPLLISSIQSGRDEDMVLVPVFQGDLVFLSRLDGSRLIERPLSLKSEALLTSSARGSELFIADGSGAVSALNPASGETLWKQQVSKGELTGPVLWQDALWVADDSGKVYRLDVNGKVLSDVQLPGRIDRSPVITTQGVLVRNNLGTLFSLN